MNLDGQVVGRLPVDMKKYVDDDNMQFAQEIEQWDVEQQRRAAQAAKEAEAGKTSTEPSASKFLDHDAMY